MKALPLFFITAHITASQRNHSSGVSDPAEEKQARRTYVRLRAHPAWRVQRTRSRRQRLRKNSPSDETSPVEPTLDVNYNKIMLASTMNTHTHRAARSVLLVTALLLSSCNFKYDTVLFTAVDKKPVTKTPAAKTPVPKVEIDTNIAVPNLLGGSVKSKKPYNIRAYYIDDTFTFVAADITTVTVTYADGTQAPKVAALKMPMHFPAQPYESYNSTSEGVVKTTERIIKAEFPRVITRDEPFTLLIKGQFTQKNGTTIPFTIMEKYDISRDKRTEKWADFMGGI